MLPRGTTRCFQVASSSKSFAIPVQAAVTLYIVRGVFFKVSIFRPLIQIPPKLFQKLGIFKFTVVGVPIDFWT